MLVTKVIRTLDVVAPSVSKTLNAPAIRSAITSVASIHARPLVALTLNVPFAITSPFASAPRDSPVIHSFLALHHPAPVSSADRAAIIVPHRLAEPTPNVVSRTAGLSAPVKKDSWAILSRVVVVNANPISNVTPAELV